MPNQLDTSVSRIISVQKYKRIYYATVFGNPVRRESVRFKFKVELDCYGYAGTKIITRKNDSPKIRANILNLIF